MVVGVRHCRGNVCNLLLSCLLGFLSVAPAESQQAAPQGQLKIEVPQGDDGNHQTNTRYAAGIVIVVKDEMDRPVPGAQVVLTLPSDGAGAVFVNGAKTTQALTKADGSTQIAGLRANNIRGSFAIRATASFGGETVTMPIKETNVPPPPVTRKRVAIVGAACAAVLIPVLALRSTPPPKATISAVGPAAPVTHP
jgi:hypothetical protein